MMNTDSRECRDLIARLSDGTLSSPETLRLNEILKRDPIAQQAYLDHMSVDGMLEREFSGTPDSLDLNTKSVALLDPLPDSRSPRSVGPPTRRTHTLTGLSIAVTLATCLVFAVAAFLGDGPSATADHSQHVPLVLSDAGFESHTLNPAPLPSGGGWFGDQAGIVKQHSGIDPLEGNRMLHLDESDSSNSHQRAVYQVIDLHADDQPGIDGTQSVFASASFNTAIDDDQAHQLYGIRIYAYADKPVHGSSDDPSEWGRPLAIADRQLAADFDEESWQNVSAQLNLPAKARYLVIQLSVIQPGSESDGDQADEDDTDHFVDKVTLSLVSSL